MDARTYRRCGAAWLSLDPADNDPQRFWNYVLGAIDHALLGSATEAAALLRGLHPAPTETVLTVLLNRLHAIEQPLVFVLDDYHLIAHPSIHDGLTFAIEHLPTHVHLVLTSRSVPELPLHRWRARDQVIEIRAEHLRFTPEETRRFLIEGMRLSLTDEQVMTLDARTEGWAAGIQLAALTLRQQPDPAAFVTHFAASHRTALDYLVEEVFAHQPEHIQHFLLHTSLLERLSPALCDAVMGVLQPFGEPWSRLLLDRIHQQNLFLIPLDEQQTWYRYHHLFAVALRQRLLRNAPELVPELHRRAAAWFADHQLHAEAIDHALHAHAYDVAADLIEDAAGPTAQRGETATVQRWLDALPPQVRTSRIDLLLWNAWLALMRPDWTALVQHVVEAERVINAVEPLDSPRRGEVCSFC